MNDWQREYGSFSRAVLGRLEVGAMEYQDKSFDADPDDLVGEIMQECQDIAGWAFVLHRRLERMRKMIEEVADDGKQGG